MAYCGLRPLAGALRSTMVWCGRLCRAVRLRSTVGECFTDFLHRCRIEEAKRLLADTPVPITQVAFRVGFSTSQLFARLFRKYSGQTPSKYRAQFRR